GGGLLDDRIRLLVEQECPRLEQQQLTGDAQELDQQVGVELLERVDLAQVLIGYFGQADVRDRQPALLDQAEQQLQRTREGAELQSKLVGPLRRGRGRGCAHAPARTSD